MADLTRAEELVQAMERDAAFRNEVEAAPTIEAKRQLIDARGFGDIGLEDMKAYVERQGGTLTLRQGGRELSEQELAAVAGGMTDAEMAGLIGGGLAAVVVGVPVVVALAAASA